METKYEMMAQAYLTYLSQEKDLEFGTMDGHRETARSYYRGDTDDNPPYLGEAEQMIGFNE